MNKDQLIADQAEKIERLEKDIALYKRMIHSLLAANRVSLIKAEMVEKDCAEVFFSRFFGVNNEFGFAIDSPFNNDLFVD